MGELAERAVAKLVPPDRLRLVRAQLAWSNIARGRLQHVTWPIALRDHVLTIAVVDNQWLHELSYLRADILERLGELCPRAEVGELRFRVGPIESIPEEAAPPDPPRPEGLPDEPSSETLEALGDIEDPGLRQAIANARLALSHRLQR